MLEYGKLSDWMSGLSGTKLWSREYKTGFMHHKEGCISETDAKDRKYQK